MVNTMVYVLAEKYDIPDLKTLAVKKVQYSLKRHWDIPCFTSALRYIYENSLSSDRGLRDVFMTRAHADEHAHRGKKNQKDLSLLFHPDYVDLVMDIGEIGVDLLRRWRGPLKFMPTGDGVFFYCIASDGGHECSRKANECLCPCGQGLFYPIEEVVDGRIAQFMCGNKDCSEVFERNHWNLTRCGECRANFRPRAGSPSGSSSD